MPYKLEQASPRGWYVVTIETGKKHSSKPMSLAKAKAQMRVLESAMKSEGGGIRDEFGQMMSYAKSGMKKGGKISLDHFYAQLHPHDVESLHKLVFIHKDHLAKTPFGKHIPAILNASTHKEAKELIHKADKEIGGAFTANIRGGAFFSPDPRDTTSLEIPFSNLQPNGYNPILGGEHNKKLGINQYNKTYAIWISDHPWMHYFGPPSQALYDEQEGMIPQLKELKAKVDEIVAQQQPFKGKVADLNSKIAKSGSYMAAAPFQAELSKLMIAYKQLDAQKKDAFTQFINFRNKVSDVFVIQDPAQQQDFIRGYNEVQALYNNWTHETWRESTDPTRFLPIKGPYDMGRVWGAMYNRAWQPQIDWRSGFEKFVDKAKEGLDIFLSGIVAPFRLAAKIDPELGFGVPEIADAIGVPSIGEVTNTDLPLGI